MDRIDPRLAPDVLARQVSEGGSIREVDLDDQLVPVWVRRFDGPSDRGARYALRWEIEGDDGSPVWL